MSENRAAATESGKEGERHQPHRLVQAIQVLPVVHGTSAAGRVNGYLAVRATAVLSSMWFFWFCCLLDLAELPAVIAANSVIAWVTYVSQTVIQLLALPLLGAGQRIISAAQDARAETDHETLVALHQMSEQQIEILKGQNEILDLLRKAVVKA